MAIQKIAESSQQTLEPWGDVAAAITIPAPQIAGIRRIIPGLDTTRVGIWECSPGQFRATIEDAEIMHILAGRAVFTFDGEEPVEFEAGDTLLFPANTKGTWNVIEKIRKIFVVVPK